MNKSEKIQACIGNIEFKSIHKIVGCSHSLVHDVFYSYRKEKVKPKIVEPIKEPKKRRTKQITKSKELIFEKDMEVLIDGDPKSWTVNIVGRSFLELNRNSDTCSVMKRKVTEIVSP